MFKYLIIQLDDSSTSFCHYQSVQNKRRLMDYDLLKEALCWSMQENLTVQFLYPNYTLPSSYKEIIESVYHAKLVDADNEDTQTLANADVVICNDWDDLKKIELKESQSYILRVNIREFFNNYSNILDFLPKVARFNVVFTDVENYDEDLNSRYSQILSHIADVIVDEYKRGHIVQFNLLTDRMFLHGMNNCNAGVESISFCPDGRFYLCPAFYGESSKSIGDLKNGLSIKNSQLYRLDHAPICKNCDAWHCKRCVWINKRLTLEFNTPGRQQCIMAHIERNASRRLLKKLQSQSNLLLHQEITEIDYLDPLELITEK